MTKKKRQSPKGSITLDSQMLSRIVSLTKAACNAAWQKARQTNNTNNTLVSLEKVASTEMQLASNSVLRVSAYFTLDESSRQESLNSNSQSARVHNIVWKIFKLRGQQLNDTPIVVSTKFLTLSVSYQGTGRTDSSEPSTNKYPLLPTATDRSYEDWNGNQESRQRWMETLLTSRNHKSVKNGEFGKIESLLKMMGGKEYSVKSTEFQTILPDINWNRTSKTILVRQTKQLDFEPITLDTDSYNLAENAINRQGSDPDAHLVVLSAYSLIEEIAYGLPALCDNQQIQPQTTIEVSDLIDYRKENTTTMLAGQLGHMRITSSITLEIIKKPIVYLMGSECNSLGCSSHNWRLPLVKLFSALNAGNHQVIIVMDDDIQYETVSKLIPEGFSITRLKSSDTTTIANGVDDIFVSLQSKEEESHNAMVEIGYATAETAQKAVLAKQHPELSAFSVSVQAYNPYVQALNSVKE
ncbi:MAG: hypothetical protein K2X81_10105 [Candidatus Obscuribacterales bacterium]|nr:hypothetical protein [Candidatus Obscuribacterales bacterium]